MHVVVARSPGLEAFSSLSEDPASFSKWVAARWADGESVPRWCFTMMEGETVAGRVGFWSSRAEPAIGRLFGLRYAAHIPEDAKRRFLGECVASMRDEGKDVFETRLFSSDAAHAQTRALLESCGFVERQQKIRLQNVSEVNRSEPETRLSYRSLSQVGENDFVEAIERVTVGTLDRLDRQDTEDAGGRKAATTLFDSLSEMDRNESWWELGYYRGSLAGLIVPQMVDDGIGVINYIGIVPEHRGNGYVDDLLTRGTWRLQGAVGKVIAETDAQNKPMLDALARAGYVEQSRMWHLELR